MAALARKLSFSRRRGSSAKSSDTAKSSDYTAPRLGGSPTRAKITELRRSASPTREGHGMSPEARCVQTTPKQPSEARRRLRRGGTRAGEAQSWRGETFVRPTYFGGALGDVGERVDVVARERHNEQQRRLVYRRVRGAQAVANALDGALALARRLAQRQQGERVVRALAQRLGQRDEQRGGTACHVHCKSAASWWLTGAADK